MNAGQLRHKIDIQEESFDPDENRDAMGQHIESWASIGSCWCSIKPLAGLENYYGESIKAGITHEIRMRYFERLKPKMRLIHDKDDTQRVFEIKSVKNVDERDRMTICMCTENVD